MNGEGKGNKMHCRLAMHLWMPLGRLELPFLAPEANALSTELQGRVRLFYHERKRLSYTCAVGASLISSARSFWMVARSLGSFPRRS